MKNIFVIATVFLLASCSYYQDKMKSDDPLLLPPNFAEIPDANNPEKPVADQKDAEAKKLKELLLKSDN